MLDWIAGADYGKDREEHMAGLRQIRDTCTFPPDMVRFPGEVLELRRWSYPDDPEGSPSGLGEFGHWMGAFCCAALLRATREPYNYGDGLSTDQSLINLIRSLRFLPINLSTEAVRSLSWLLRNSDPEGMDEQVCAYGIGLLWFALQLVPNVEDATLIELAGWVIRRSKELYPKLIFEDGGIPLRMGVGNPPPSPWGWLGIWIAELDLSSRSPELRGQIELIAQKLAE